MCPKRDGSVLQIHHVTRCAEAKTSSPAVAENQPIVRRQARSNMSKLSAKFDSGSVFLAYIIFYISSDLLDGSFVYCTF